MNTRQDKIRRYQARPEKIHTQLGRAAVQIFAANERINQILIEHLDPAAWTAKLPTAKPPGTTRKITTRSIAAIFTHMHNVRTKWVRLTAPHLKIPPQLNRADCTPQQARTGLAESAARCAEMLAEALGGGGRVGKFRRDGWARPWPVGPEMLCYMLSHETHHRGQVCMLAHQLGFPLPVKVTSGMWNWEKLWKECGSRNGPGGDC
ncbi:MAG: DinB family protein [Candidatus Sulfotelmatobacter sp.]